MDSGGKIKEAPLLIAIEVSADVRAVLAVVGILGGIFDDVNVGTLCWVSRPLDGSPGPSDAQGDAVQEFEFWNEEVVERVVPFPDPCPSIKDCLLVFMKDS